MNFETWYNSLKDVLVGKIPEINFFKKHFHVWEKDNYRIGWDACKKEVLKILYEKGNSHWASCGERYYHENIKEEIEKL